MVLTDGSESWCRTKTLENTLNTFEKKCLRIILGIRWDVFKADHEGREMAKQTYVSNVIRKKEGSIMVTY